MLKVLQNRIEQGCKTSKYPLEPITLYHRYRGLPVIDPGCSLEIVRRCAEICPQGAIDVEAKTIDLGRCTFCGQCEVEGEGRFIRFSQDFGRITSYNVCYTKLLRDIWRFYSPVQFCSVLL